MFMFFNPTDRPTPPRNLVISNIKAESCYLNWDAPEDDGGTEITNYIVERKDKSKETPEWEAVNNCVIDRKIGVSINIV